MTIRWLLTAVFAAAALGVVLPPRRMPGREPPGGELAVPVRRAECAAAVLCLVMCVAMITMAWWPEPAAATRAQAAGFGCAAIAFVAGRRTWPGPDRLRHALMAGVMIWMLIALPGAPAVRPPGHGHGAMAAMPGAGPAGPVLVGSGLLAVCCVAAAKPWLARAVGSGPRIADPAAAGQAAMSIGMAAMLIAML